MQVNTFQRALHRIVTDESYRDAIRTNPNQLTADYELSRDELGTLASVWRASEGSEVEAHLSLSCCSSSCCII